MSLRDEARSVGMSEIQLNAIMGSLLGDASLQKPSKVAAPIRWNHSVKQRDYVNAKYQLLREFATREPFEKANPGYGDSWYALTLKSLGVFLSLHQLLYPNGHEGGMVLTQEYLDQIDHPIALAWWYLDDGSRSKGANVCHIHTNSYQRSEVELLQKWLMEKWGIKSEIQDVTHTISRKMSWQLSIPKEGFLRLSELVSLYTPDSMKYKTEILMQKCPVCGKDLPIQQMDCCSEECDKVWKKQKNHQYYLDNIEKHKEQGKRYREEHREEILAQKREWSKQRVLRRTDEERAEIAKRARERAAARDADPEARAIYLAKRKAQREAAKNDPVAQEKIRSQRQRYYEKLKADPERWKKRLEASRQRKQRSSQEKKNSSAGIE